LKVGWEIAANGFNTVSIILAGRNNVHTWWTGIVGCVLFAVVFFWARLYADLTLQTFFIVTSILGWWNWMHGRRGTELPIRATRPSSFSWLTAAGILVAIGYGLLLDRFTNAYAPFLDSVILAFSVLGQFLLMDRRIENWWCWLLVNTIAVPLYTARGLRLTAALYAIFWVNAVVSLKRWRYLLRLQRQPGQDLERSNDANSGPHTTPVSGL
jgi:nicotinamide mononucleotide transporter